MSILRPVSPEVLLARKMRSKQPILSHYILSASTDLLCWLLGNAFQGELAFSKKTEPSFLNTAFDVAFYEAGDSFAELCGRWELPLDLPKEYQDILHYMREEAQVRPSPGEQQSMSALWVTRHGFVSASTLKKWKHSPRVGLIADKISPDLSRLLVSSLPRTQLAIALKQGIHIKGGNLGWCMSIMDGYGNVGALPPSVAASELVTGRIAEASRVERIYHTLLREIQEVDVLDVGEKLPELPEWLWRALEIPHCSYTPLDDTSGPITSKRKSDNVTTTRKKRRIRRKIPSSTTIPEHNASSVRSKSPSPTRSIYEEHGASLVKSNSIHEEDASPSNASPVESNFPVRSNSPSPARSMHEEDASPSNGSPSLAVPLLAAPPTPVSPTPAPSSSAEEDEPPTHPTPSPPTPSPPTPSPATPVPSSSGSHTPSTRVPTPVPSSSAEEDLEMDIIEEYDPEFPGSKGFDMEIIEEYNPEFPGFVYAAAAANDCEANDEAADDTAYEGDESENEEEDSEDKESTLAVAFSTLTTALGSEDETVSEGIGQEEREDEERKNEESEDEKSEDDESEDDESEGEEGTLAAAFSTLTTTLPHEDGNEESMIGDALNSEASDDDGSESDIVERDLDHEEGVDDLLDGFGIL